MAYPNQKDSARYLIGKKNELEKSPSRKIARFWRNSRVIPGFFSFLINKVGPGHLLKFFTKDVSPEVWRAAFSGSLWAWMVWSGLAGLTAETVLLGHTARLSETLHNCMYTLKRETLGSNLYDNSAITRTEKQKLTGDKMHMAASCWPDWVCHQLVSRGRGRDRECRRCPNVVTNNFNFNLTLFGL